VAKCMQAATALAVLDQIVLAQLYMLIGVE